jgi:hypothetical protein
MATRAQAIGIPIVDPARTDTTLTPAPGIPLTHDPEPLLLPLADFGALALCAALLGAATGAGVVVAADVGVVSVGAAMTGAAQQMMVAMASESFDIEKPFRRIH